VYATSDLRPTSVAGHSYRYDWIFIRPRALTGNTFWVVLSHELGHATLSHGRVEIPRDRMRAVLGPQEDAANRRGVEIMTRFGGFTERQALDLYATYLIEANRVRDGRDVALPFGHRLPCERLRQLWSSFGQTAPPCEAFTSVPEVKDCPYDDWMSTGCKTGQPLTPGRPRPIDAGSRRDCTTSGSSPMRSTSRSAARFSIGSNADGSWGAQSSTRPRCRR
jgi:hypothetical protein